MAAQMAERWYKRLSRLFNHDLRGKQPLIMYASHPQFEQTTVLTEVMSEGTGGVTESVKRRIILPFGGTLDDTDHVIGHELVHAFQYDMSAGRGRATAMPGRAGRARAGAPLVHRGLGRILLHRPRRSPDRHVDARHDPQEEAADHQGPRRIPTNISLIATARRSGPISAAGGATSSWPS